MPQNTSLTGRLPPSFHATTAHKLLSYFAITIWACSSFYQNWMLNNSLSTIFITK